MTPSPKPVIGQAIDGLELDADLAVLLEDAPITRITLPYGDPAWLLSRYSDIQAVTNDSRFTRAALGVTVDPPRVTPTFIVPPDAVQRKDLPRSAMMRESIGKGINHRRMRAYSEVVQQVVEAAIDDLVRHGRPGDLIETVSSRVPLTVMGRLMDIPRPVLDDIRRWTTSLFSMEPERHEETAAAKKGLFGYLGGLLQERRAHPGGDMASRLIADSGGLTDGEIITALGQLLAIGIAPTNALLGDILYAMLTRPGQVERFRSDPAGIPRFIEETARYTQVLVGFGPALVALEDVHFDGVTIAAGESVVYSYASGNRDPAVFERPAEFDDSRTGTKHLMFGAGQHACVGQHFSRLVFETVLTTLVTRLPGIELAVPENEIRWDGRTIWRFPETLPVNW
ncbi:cytochrome P450 [Actinoallomurus spadix]|uniref:Cytochrome P450 n=1 Tax=Actinoallomurus spadix TaxID=79912 RepID=A0ABP3H108_9ACTN|nr:cytochrome P450 [Actinoallomurus spadix]MCO5987970.1 cytochrome P450 [Actinoallomurus spadix]